MKRRKFLTTIGSFIVGVLTVEVTANSGSSKGQKAQQLYNSPKLMKLREAYKREDRSEAATNEMLRRWNEYAGAWAKGLS